MSANNPHEMQVRVAKLFERLSVVASGPQIADEDLDPRLLPIRAHNHPDNRLVFSCFMPSHLAKAEELYKVFYRATDFEDLMHLAEQARSFVNSTMFAFAFEVAFLHKSDYHGITLPPVQEVFADRFVPATTFVEAFTVANARQPGDESPVVVDVVATGNIRDPEYKLAYYREDIGINAHHWHWHIVYPSTYDPEFFGAMKDRKGELFYYMHQQMCARYDCERLSNGLECMTPFNDFTDTLDGYAAHLIHVASGRSFASRPDGQTLKDLKGEYDVSVQDMKRWIRYISDAIDLGIVIQKDGTGIKLDETNGINILGALVESSRESVNQHFYGNLHNAFHVMVAYIHDSDGRFKETPGVMTDTAAALRDPIFYRFHRCIDNIFDDYKKTLAPYTQDQLDFKDVDLTEVKVDAKTPNVIHTFMREDELELHHTVHFGNPESVRARYYHLDHECFSYIIKCQNNANVLKEATVRIFLAPTRDEKDNEIPLNVQRRLYIEMDKFHFTLQPGKNTIVRSSIHSSVTISNSYTFRQVLNGDNLHENKDEFCSCGWPQHLLVPKGNSKGMEYDLFVMLTDAQTDKVQADDNLCSDALSYCGVMGQKYPDKKAMGYPFDRKIDDEEHFLRHNMRVSHIKVQFQE